MRTRIPLGSGILLLSVCAVASHAESPGGPRAAPGADAIVTYEAFGAAGDGVTDDLEAICASMAAFTASGRIFLSP